jgi:ATP synthase protein I
MVAFQAGTAVVVGLLFLLGGVGSALAALIGGMIIATGNALFGWRLFVLGVAPAARLARSVYAAETLKWLWVVLALWLALTRAGLPGLPLIVGVIAAQIAFWLGLAFFK